MGHQRTRAAALLAVAGAGTEALRLLALHPLVALAEAVAGGRDLTTIPLDQLVSAGCALALLACWAWWLLAGLVTTLDVLRHGAVSAGGRRWCPAVVRAVVLAALGVATAAGPATADPAGVQRPASAPADAEGVAGLALPDRVSTPAHVTAHRSHPGGTVRVRAGDSLWAIAARQLPPSATDAAVSDAWHRLARANTDRIGDDPDLIFPGTVLRVPDRGTPPGKEPT